MNDKLGFTIILLHLKKILTVCKISACWISHLLTDEQKSTMVQMAKKVLEKYPKYQKKGIYSLINTPTKQSDAQPLVERGKQFKCLLV